MNAVVETPGVRVREMRPEDLADVLVIEKQSYDFPWTANIFRDCLRVGYTCFVLDNGDGVDGYAVMAIGAGDAHVLNLCVAQERRRLGLGRHLLDHLMEAAHRLNASRLYLEVRPSNQIALKLYRAAGFVPIGVRKDYYQARVGREDAIVLTRAVEAVQ